MKAGTNSVEIKFVEHISSTLLTFAKFSILDLRPVFNVKFLGI
jgi:hypothetical protein